MVSFQQLQRLAPCRRRWAIYESILAEQMATLEAVAQAPFARTALNDASLFQPFVELLDLIAAVGVAQDLSELRARIFNPQDAAPRTCPEVNSVRQRTGTKEINPDGKDRSTRTPIAAYQWYFDKFVDPSFPNGNEPITGVALFLERFPLTAHYLETIARQFCANLRETVQRIEQDRDLLSQLFFPARPIDSIHKIEPSGADTHKGGKQVMFITFRLEQQTFASRGFGKLVYKPSDVELDYRICGDTVALTNSMGAGAPNPFGAALSLVERVNQFTPETDQLPTYRILPCNPGSRLQEENAILPIGQSYGYIEFLSSGPARRADGLPGSPSDSVVQSSDWLCANDEELTRFYRTWGQWLALARLFSLGDLHEENVIAHRKKPCPIDFEISCTGPMTSLAGTQVARGVATGGLDSSTAVHYRPQRLFDRTGNLSFDPPNRINDVNTPTMNRVVIKTEGAWVRPYAIHQMNSIVDGMRATCLIVSAHRAEFLAWLDAVGNCVARFTPYSTGQYTRALALMSYSPAYARRRPPIPGTDDQINRNNLSAWQAVVDPVLTAVEGAWPPNRPNAALSSFANDYRDFADHDIPAYYHRLDSAQLRNARGEIVVVGNAPPDNRTTYFPHPTIGSVRTQVAELDDAHIDAQLENAINVISWATDEPERGARLLPDILAALGLSAAQA